MSMCATAGQGQLRHGYLVVSVASRVNVKVTGSSALVTTQVILSPSTVIATVFLPCESLRASPSTVAKVLSLSLNACTMIFPDASGSAGCRAR